MSPNKVEVRKANGGYILVDKIGVEHLCVSIKDVFEHMLTTFEGRFETGYDSAYGKVTVEYQRDKK